MDAVRQVKSATDRGADVSFEVARIDATYNGAISNVKRDGTVVVVSVFEDTVETNPNDIVMAERVVRGTMSYLTSNHSNDEFRAVAEMMANGQLNPEQPITDSISLNEIMSGFESPRDLDGHR